MSNQSGGNVWFIFTFTQKLLMVLTPTPGGLQYITAASVGSKAQIKISCLTFENIKW